MANEQQVEDQWDIEFYDEWGKHSDFRSAWEAAYTWRDRFQRLRRFDLKGAITGRYWTGVVGAIDDET